MKPSLPQPRHAPRSQQTLEIPAQRSQIGEGDTQALPADSPLQFAGNSSLREEIVVRRCQRLADLRQVGCVAMAMLLQRARIGLEFPPLPGFPQCPAEPKEQDGDEAEE